MKLPSLNQILMTISNDCEFVVYYNELTEDLTHAIATSGDWETVRGDAKREGFLRNEVAEVSFDGGMIFVYLV